MAITAVTRVQHEQLGFSNLRILTLSLDNSYPTGGYALSPTQLGIGRTARWVMAAPKNGYIFEYIYSTSKLMVFWVDNNAVADSALIEVPNTTDLSAVTGVRVMAVGY